MNLTEVTDLTSTGTLFAFALVCGGVLKLDPNRQGGQKKRFRIPYINSKYIFPSLVAVAAFAVGSFKGEELSRFFETLGSAPWDELTHHIPVVAYASGMLVLAYFCFRKNLSLIPVLGLASCTYLMTELGITNWIRFGVWLIVGFCVYFLYGVRHSKLRARETPTREPAPVQSPSY